MCAGLSRMAPCIPLSLLAGITAYVLRGGAGSIRRVAERISGGWMVHSHRPIGSAQRECPRPPSHFTSSRGSGTTVMPTRSFERRSGRTQISSRWSRTALLVQPCVGSVVCHRSSPYSSRLHVYRLQRHRSRHPYMPRTLRPQDRWCRTGFLQRGRTDRPLSNIHNGDATGKGGAARMLLKQ